MIVARGDAAATAQNVLSHRFLFRLGLAVHLVTVLLNLPLGILLYDLLKVVNRRLALGGAFFILASATVEGVDLLIRAFAPLVLLDGGQLSNAFTTGQLQSLVYMSLANSTGPSAIGSATSLAFFSVFCLSSGYLIFRSNLLPRAVGVLMAIAGLCYLVNSFATFLSPELATIVNPYILLPSGIGEISFALWLLVFGVNRQGWSKRASLARVVGA